MSLHRRRPAGTQRTGTPADHSVPLVIVNITSAPVAGTYTVAWRTLGGCDPGSDTSGAPGEVTLTVKATGSPDETPAPGELTGRPDVAVVVTRPFCLYTWSVSFVEATTDANCIVGPAPFAPDDHSRKSRLTREPGSTGLRPKREKPTSTGVGCGDGRHTI